MCCLPLSATHSRRCSRTSCNARRISPASGQVGRCSLQAGYCSPQAGCCPAQAGCWSAAKHSVVVHALLATLVGAPPPCRPFARSLASSERAGGDAAGKSASRRLARPSKRLSSSLHGFVLALPSAGAAKRALVRNGGSHTPPPASAVPEAAEIRTAPAPAPSGGADGACRWHARSARGPRAVRHPWHGLPRVLYEVRKTPPVCPIAT
jgi:hypothetical protein